MHKPHELRVIEEKRDLDEKIVKLTRFMLTKEFRELDRFDAMHLKTQRKHMEKYSKALGCRIDLFTTR